MSEGEVVVSVVCVGAAIMAWGLWYYTVAAVTTFGTSIRLRLPLLVMPVACLILLLWILRDYADEFVRDSNVYQVMYLAMGAAWVGLTARAMPVIGVSARDDALERRNTAAGFAVTGGLLGLTFCFAGANIGDGPGWWVVLFSAALATAGLFAAWAVVESFTHVADAVTIDRDDASGLRLGGFLAASGMLLGRAVAGDWVSVNATWFDFFITAWPVAGLIALHIAMHQVLRPTPQRPHPNALSHGLLPAMLQIAVGLLFLLEFGWW
jgi:hypothetical protein